MLHCGVSRDGSYILPLSLGAPSQRHVDVPDLTRNILEQLYQLLSALTSDSRDQVTKLLPDSRLRDRALRGLALGLPRPGEQWSLGFAAQGQDEIHISVRSARRAEAWTLELETLDEVMTVTGELIRIDFDQHKVVLRYPPTGRDLECVYLPDIEDTIIESRREPIQVTGRFILDGEGHPLRLSDVTRIETVDLSAMSFSHVEHNGRVLVLTPPITLYPMLDEESSQLLVATDQELGIHVYAQTREALVEELAEQLLFLWDTYAQEAPDRLTSDACQLGQVLRQRLREAA